MAASGSFLDRIPGKESHGAAPQLVRVLRNQSFKLLPGSALGDYLAPHFGRGESRLREGFTKHAVIVGSFPGRGIVIGLAWKVLSIVLHSSLRVSRSPSHRSGREIRVALSQIDTALPGHGGGQALGPRAHISALQPRAAFPIGTSGLPSGLLRVRYRGRKSG